MNTHGSKGREERPENDGWAAIFDWDGVIIDSSRQHEESWNRLAEEEGRTLPENHFKKGFGMTGERIIREVLGWTRDPEELRRLTGRKAEYYREIVRTEGIEALPGVVDWIERLNAEGIPMAVASSTSRKNIDLVLDLLNLASFFQGIVTGDEVERGKPDPEVFLSAADQIGVPPGRCVVFEDAQVGIDAARAAGMRVVAVTTTHPAGDLEGTDRVVDRLDELSVRDMSGWFT